MDRGADIALIAVRAMAVAQRVDTDVLPLVQGHLNECVISRNDFVAYAWRDGILDVVSICFWNFRVGVVHIVIVGIGGDSAVNLQADDAHVTGESEIPTDD